MSVDEGEAITAQPAAVVAKSAAQTPGQVLRRAREQHNLNVQHIADELHLDTKLVLALEADDFFSLGAPVYAKGYLRKYAVLVGLPPQEMIALYERLTDVPPTPTVAPVASSYQPRQRISLRIPFLIVVGLASLALIGWLAVTLLERFHKTPAASANTTQATANVTQSPPTTDVPLAPAADVEPAKAAPAAAAPVTSAGSASTNTVSLRLQFNASSWVEIYDGANKRLLYDIGQPGQTRTVSGQPPLRVTLGLSSAVTVAVNDRAVPVPRRADRDAARFTVMPDGSLR
ncbi:MAG: helix-turn-helix domain-containing protein [Povalibacter sp.]